MRTSSPPVVATTLPGRHTTSIASSVALSTGNGAAA
jgi:hypothetical protein